MKQPKGGVGGGGSSPGRGAAGRWGHSRARCPHAHPRTAGRRPGSGPAGVLEGGRGGRPREGRRKLGRGGSQHARGAGTATRPGVAVGGDTGVRGGPGPALWVGEGAGGGTLHPRCWAAPPRYSAVLSWGSPRSAPPPRVPPASRGSGGLLCAGRGGQDGGRGPPHHEPRAGWGAQQTPRGSSRRGVAGGWGQAPGGLHRALGLNLPGREARGGGPGGAAAARRCPPSDGHLILPGLLRRKQTARGWTPGGGTGQLPPRGALGGHPRAPTVLEIVSHHVSGPCVGVPAGV